MIHRIVPHTPEWFAALERFDARQASITEQVVSLAGSEDVCSVCGDTPAHDHEIVKPVPVDGAVATVRLCDHCLDMRTGAGEGFVPF